MLRATLVAATNDLTQLWHLYREREASADRAAALEALGHFVTAVEAAPPDERAAWADECLRAASDPEGKLRIRSPLFQRVLFPELEARYRQGDAAAARALAELSSELFRHRSCWAALGYPGELDLWKEAYRRDPDVRCRSRKARRSDRALHPVHPARVAEWRPLWL